MANIFGFIKNDLSGDTVKYESIKKDGNVVNKKYVLEHAAIIDVTSISELEGPTENFSFLNKKLTNLGNSENPLDAVNQQKCSEIVLNTPLNHLTLPDNRLNMNNFRIINLLDGINSNNGVNLGQLNSSLITVKNELQSDFVAQADLDMFNFKINNLSTPISDYQASTKKYVDDNIYQVPLINGLLKSSNNNLIELATSSDYYGPNFLNPTRFFAGNNCLQITNNSTLKTDGNWTQLGFNNTGNCGSASSTVILGNDILIAQDGTGGAFSGCSRSVFINSRVFQSAPKSLTDNCAIGFNCARFCSNVSNNGNTFLGSSICQAITTNPINNVTLIGFQANTGSAEINNSASFGSNSIIMSSQSINLSTTVDTTHVMIDKQSSVYMANGTSLELNSDIAAKTATSF